MAHEALVMPAVLSAAEQIEFDNARDRRRSLLGVVDLHRTLQVPGIPTATIPNASFPLVTRQVWVTFVTAIRIGSGATHRGLIFELGSSTSGVAAWVEDDRIGFTAGNGAVTTVDAATGTFVITGGLPDTLVLDLVLAVRPADGKIRVWVNGFEEIRATASGGSLLSGQWADAGDGSFAAAPNGTVALNVPATSRVAPNGFDVILPLSVYAKQIPKHFI